MYYLHIITRILLKNRKNALYCTHHFNYGWWCISYNFLQVHKELQFFDGTLQGLFLHIWWFPTNLIVYPCTPGALCTLAMHLLPLQSKSDTLLSVLESHSAHHHWLLTPEFRSVKLCLFSSTPTIHQLLEHNRTFVLSRRKPWMDMRDQGICSSVLSLSGYFQITVLLKRIAGC